MTKKLTTSLMGCALIVAVGLTGCQSNYSGQVLPSPYYRSDDLQYFAPGNEFKLANEAAALEQQRAAVESVPQP